MSNEIWRRSPDEHKQAIVRFLTDKYHIPTPPPNRPKTVDTQTDFDMAETAAHRLVESLVKNTREKELRDKPVTDKLVPDDWQLKDSLNLADKAFWVGIVARERLTYKPYLDGVPFKVGDQVPAKVQEEMKKTFQLMHQDHNNCELAFVNTMISYLNSALDVGWPEFEGNGHFAKQKFLAKEYMSTMTGEAVLREALKLREAIERGVPQRGV